MRKILLGIILCGFTCLGFYAYRGSLAAAKTNELQTAEPTAGAGTTRTDVEIVKDLDTYVLSGPICDTKPDNEITVTMLLVENFDSTQYATENDLIPLMQTDVYGVVVAEPTKTPVE